MIGLATFQADSGKITLHLSQTYRAKDNRFLDNIVRVKFNQKAFLRMKLLRILTSHKLLIKQGQGGIYLRKQET